MKVFLTGASGRLGREVATSFLIRGDEIVAKKDPVNYLVFAHRYRPKGERSYLEEMDVNLNWVHHTIERATFCEGDKAIVLVSSVSALDPAMDQSLAYNLSKAGLNQLARYYAKKGHRINTVSPNTFTGEAPIVTKKQVADVIMFLCSPQSSGINGQDIRIG